MIVGSLRAIPNGVELILYVVSKRLSYLGRWKS